MLEHMVTQYRERGRSRLGKGENFTSEKLQAVREEYDEATRLCVFRVESLKQGQCRSLLTQAARHHTAQVLLYSYVTNVIFVSSFYLSSAYLF